MVTFSVGRAYPRAKELFRHMPSSNGELTVQSDIRTFWQQSISMPSRLVSILTLSIVMLSVPVAKIPNHPPCLMEISLMITFLHIKRLIDLLARLSPFFPLRTRPLPQIMPLPLMVTSCNFTPQMRLL